MSKFTKILIVLLLILLVEIIFIYKGYIDSRNKGIPTIKDTTPFYYTVHVSNEVEFFKIST